MSLTVYRYNIPFRKSLQTRKKSFSHRRGLILEYNTGRDLFYSETAPLPNFSPESLTDVIECLKNLFGDISDALKDDHPITLISELYANFKIPPSLAFGLDSLAYQITADKKQQSLGTFLFDDYHPTLPVNTLGSLLSDHVVESVQHSINEGFSTIKFKIGINFDLELKQLQQIRSKFSDLTIRLDANQAWELDEAIIKCQKLSDLNIEYCEEPLRKATPYNFEELTKNTLLPIGIDESITKTDHWDQLLPFSSFVILKPMLLGSFTKILETNRFVDIHDNKTIFTTSLESGIGRIITAILAMGLGASQTAHGLATGKLLSKDLHTDLEYISAGSYSLPPNFKVSKTINTEIIRKLPEIQLK